MRPIYTGITLFLCLLAEMWIGQYAHAVKTINISITIANNVIGKGKPTMNAKDSTRVCILRDFGFCLLVIPSMLRNLTQHLPRCTCVADIAHMDTAASAGPFRLITPARPPPCRWRGTPL